jgi:hypothetical protein
VSDRLCTTGCTNALMHHMARAYREGVASELPNNGLGADPAIVEEVRNEIMLSSDPRMPDIIEWLERNVDFEPKRTEEQRGKKIYAYLSQKDLLNRYWQEYGDASHRRRETVSKSSMKLLLQRAMEMKGRRCRTLWTTPSSKVIGFERVKWVE